MSNVHQLKVEFDVVEPRPQFGRLMAPLDGTKVDLTNSYNVWQDPATLTIACSAPGYNGMVYNFQRIVCKVSKDRLYANHGGILEADADQGKR